MDYELKLEQYQGPLRKLLELVEEKKLEITLISLAQVTADFLSYVGKLKTQGEISPQILSDFLSVASKLVLIKSKVLLPFLELEKEEEKDIRNLEMQLKIYQELKNAQKSLKNIWSEKPQIFSREFLASAEPFFYPPSDITAENIHRTFFVFLGEFEKVFKPIETIKQEMISLKDKIEEVLSRISETSASFKNLHKGAKKEIVVLFLAILQLIKDQLIAVEQSSHFEDIIIRKN